MLHVIRTKSAIVWAAILHLGIESLWHFWLFDKHFSCQTIIVHIIGNQYAFLPMLWAPFIHVNAVLFEHNFRFHGIQTSAANRSGGIVKQVWTIFATHETPNDGLVF